MSSVYRWRLFGAVLHVDTPWRRDPGQEARHEPLCGSLTTGPIEIEADGTTRRCIRCRQLLLAALGGT